VLEAHAARHEHARPERLVLQRQADVVARASCDVSAEGVAQRRAFAVPVDERGVDVRSRVRRRERAVGLVARAVPREIRAAVEQEVEELERRAARAERRRVGRILQQVRRPLVRDGEP
jgi:hypothetical protein